MTNHLAVPNKARVLRDRPQHADVRSQNPQKQGQPVKDRKIGLGKSQFQAIL